MHKPFDWNKAKAGAPICLEDGRKIENVIFSDCYIAGLVKDKYDDGRAMGVWWMVKGEVIPKIVSVDLGKLYMYEEPPREFYIVRCIKHSNGTQPGTIYVYDKKGPNANTDSYEWIKVREVKE